MRWLPNEHLLDVFGFLSDDCLLRSVPFVCLRFWRLSELALAKFHPMVAKIVQISWNQKIASHQLFVQSVKCVNSNLSFSVRKSNRSPTNFPASPPPLNIVGIRRIRVEGKLTREVLEFLSQCAVKISHCELDFENLEDFLAELTRQNINLDEFFAVFGSRFSSVWLDGRFSSLCPVDFLRNDFLLRCSNLSILRPFFSFDAQSLQNWLNWPSANGRKKHLTIIGNGKGENEANESVEQLVQMLFDQCHCKSEKFERSKFTVELHNIHLEKPTEFDDGQMSFRMINAQFWVLNSKMEADGREIETKVIGPNENIDTFVDIGTFAY